MRWRKKRNWRSHWRLIVRQSSFWRSCSMAKSFLCTAKAEPIYMWSFCFQVLAAWAVILERRNSQSKLWSGHWPGMTGPYPASCAELSRGWSLRMLWSVDIYKLLPGRMCLQRLACLHATLPSPWWDVKWSFREWVRGCVWVLRNSEMFHKWAGVWILTIQTKLLCL